MFASVVWFHDQCSAGKLTFYEGHYVAILDKSVIDADYDEDELACRLDAMESKLPPNRVVIQYVPGCDEPLVCLTAFFPDEL